MSYYFWCEIGQSLASILSVSKLLLFFFSAFTEILDLYFRVILAILCPSEVLLYLKLLHQSELLSIALYVNYTTLVMTCQEHSLWMIFLVRIKLRGMLISHHKISDHMFLSKKKEKKSCCTMVLESGHRGIRSGPQSFHCSQTRHDYLKTVQVILECHQGLTQQST